MAVFNRRFASFLLVCVMVLRAQQVLLQLPRRRHNLDSRQTLGPFTFPIGVRAEGLPEPLTLMVEDGVHGPEGRPRGVAHSGVEGRGEGEAHFHRVLRKETQVA